MTLFQTKKFLNKHLSKTDNLCWKWDVFVWRCTELYIGFDISYHVKEIVDKQLWIIFLTERGVLIEYSLYSSVDEATQAYIRLLQKVYRDRWR